MIAVAISERDPVAEDQWHLFNDFLVRHISQAEALRFSPAWKLPTVIAYQVRGARHYVDDSWKDFLDTRCLYTEYSMKYVVLTISKVFAHIQIVIRTALSTAGFSRRI